MPQDGHDKQDCERGAGKRWMTKHAEPLAPHGVTLLGDDLYRHQPMGALALHNGFNLPPLPEADRNSKSPFLHRHLGVVPPGLPAVPGSGVCFHLDREGSRRG